MFVAGIPIADHLTLVLAGILRALEDCPPEFAGLRGVLLQEHAWRVREGLV